MISVSGSRGTAVASGEMSATRNRSRPKKMKQDWNKQFLTNGASTDRKHWPDATFQSHPFSGEGNAPLPPSERFTCFKCKSSGQWRSVPESKTRDLQFLVTTLYPVSNPRLS